MSTTTAMGIAMVTEHAETPIAMCSPTRNAPTMVCQPTPVKQVSSTFGSCAVVGGVLTLHERSSIL
jgi:hypothetical protein